MKHALIGFLAFLLAVVAGVGVDRIAFSGGKFQLPFLRQETYTPPLEVITETLQHLANSVEADADPLVSDQAAGLLNKIDVASARLERDESCDKAKLWEALNSILIARYAGVVIDRSRFAKPFDDFAQQLISEYPQSAIACNAEMLQLLARHNFHQPVDHELAADIEGFAANHTPQQGADLYCLVAVELVRNRQPDAAKAIVRQGIKAYQSSPWVISQLVNQSANLALSKPPPPSITQAQFNAMMRSYEAPCRTRSA